MSKAETDDEYYESEEEEDGSYSDSQADQDKEQLFLTNLDTNYTEITTVPEKKKPKTPIFDNPIDKVMYDCQLENQKVSQKLKQHFQQYQKLEKQVLQEELQQKELQRQTEQKIKQQRKEEAQKFMELRKKHHQKLLEDVQNLKKPKTGYNPDQIIEEKREELAQVAKSLSPQRVLVEKKLICNKQLQEQPQLVLGNMAAKVKHINVQSEYKIINDTMLEEDRKRQEYKENMRSDAEKQLRIQLGLQRTPQEYLKSIGVTGQIQVSPNPLKKAQTPDKPQIPQENAVKSQQESPRKKLDESNSNSKHEDSEIKMNQKIKLEEEQQQNKDVKHKQNKHKIPVKEESEESYYSEEEKVEKEKEKPKKQKQHHKEPQQEQLNTKENKNKENTNSKRSIPVFEAEEDTKLQVELTQVKKVKTPKQEAQQPQTVQAMVAQSNSPSKVKSMLKK